MKRSFFCSIAVLLLAGMTLPCFAAEVDRSDLRNYIAEAVSQMRSSMPGYFPSPYIVFIDSYTSGNPTVYAVKCVNGSKPGVQYVQYAGASGAVSAVRASGATDITWTESGRLRVTYKENGTSKSKTFGYWVRGATSVTPSLAGAWTSKSTVVSLVPLPLNYSALQTLVNQASRYSEQDYTASTWSAFSPLLESARAMLAGGASNQGEVDQMTASLKAAMNALELLPDAAQLRELLARLAGYDGSAYTPSSWTPLQRAVADANALLQSGSFTAADLQSMVTRLLDAESGLVKPKPPPAGTVTASMFDSFSGVFRQYLRVVIPICILIFGMIWGVSMLPGLIKKLTRGY